MQNINREHPEYIARKAMWKRYRDLYAGGERMRENAAEYLVRRHKEPSDVYQERLSRVFYENYIGSIIDWYAATLMRREPMLLFEGDDPAAKGFYSLLTDDCDLKGTSLQRVLPAAVRTNAGVRQQLHGGGFSASERAGADARGRGRIRADRAHTWWITARTRSSTGITTERRAGVGGDPDVVPAAVESHGREVGAGDAVDLLRPREIPGFQERRRIERDRAGGRGAARAGGRSGGCRCSGWRSARGCG